MIRKISFLLVLFFVVSAQESLFAQTIHYTINQMGIKAGTATLSFSGLVKYKEQDLFLIEFKADGFNFLDEELIYVDSHDYRPRFVERNLNIFGNKEKISEVYTLGKIIVTKVIGEKKTEQTIENKEAVDNIYGFMYRYMKQGKFEIGETFDIHLPTKELTIKVSKKSPLKVAGKTYESLYLESKPAKYKIWFDGSDQHLPLRIGGAIGIANTTMTLTQVTD